MVEIKSREAKFDDLSQALDKRSALVADFKFTDAQKNKILETFAPVIQDSFYLKTAHVSEKVYATLGNLTGGEIVNSSNHSEWDRYFANEDNFEMLLNISLASYLSLPETAITNLAIRFNPYRNVQMYLFDTFLMEFEDVNALRRSNLMLKNIEQAFVKKYRNCIGSGTLLDNEAKIIKYVLVPVLRKFWESEFKAAEKKSYPDGLLLMMRNFSVELQQSY